MAQHTQGPWRYQKSDKYEGDFIITGSNDGGGSILPILARTHNFPRNNKANARLIAAAPDLLELLTLSLPYVDEGERFNKPYANKLSNQIRSLIAKAEGRES